MKKLTADFGDKDLVKRNLNFHDAFQTQKHSQVPQGPGVLATMGLNKSPRDEKAKKEPVNKNPPSKTHRSKLTNSYVNDTRIVNDTIDLDAKMDDSNLVHQRLLYKNRESRIKSMELQTSRVTRVVKESE